MFISFFPCRQTQSPKNTTTEFVSFKVTCCSLSVQHVLQACCQAMLFQVTHPYIPWFHFLSRAIRGLADSGMELKALSVLLLLVGRRGFHVCCCTMH